MSGYQQIPLVGPGSELQLTIDGRAVPHAVVVAARSVAAPASASAPSGPVTTETVAGIGEGQTSL